CLAVFHRDGEPLRSIRHAWETAVVKVGLLKPKLDKTTGQPVLDAEGQPVMVAALLFHDLRRSAIKNMMKAGVREKVAMAISGHKTRAIFDRYHIVDDRDVREALAMTQASTRARGNVVPLRKEA